VPVTIAPANPTVDNSYPFGIGVTNQWPPHMGFVYQDIPAFQLNTGDVLAFDTAAFNDVDVQLQIELAATTSNGGDAPALPFTTVVTNTQTPVNPRGDTTVGNFEMQFKAQAPFSFPGGGLIIRFSNPSAAYAMDTHGDFDLVAAMSDDPSGKFVERYTSDADGLPPYTNPGTAFIGGFQVRPPDVVPGSQLTTKRKCRKRKHRAASAKKRCKKKR